MQLNIANNLIGVGDTTQLSLGYAPANLYAGYKDLTVNVGDIVRVRQNSNLVISGQDKEETWLLRSGSDPSTLTVEGYASGSVTLLLEYAVYAGGPYPGRPYNGKSVGVTVVGVSEIDVYAASQWYDVTNYAITVLRGTKYTFKAKKEPVNAAWPPQRPIWTLNGSQIATGTDTVEVTFDSVGTKTLIAKCGLTDPGKTVTITVVEPTVYQFGVDGDHALNRTPTSGSEWADSGNLIVDPIYFPDDPDPNNRNLPFCVTKNSDLITLTTVKLKVPQAISYPTVIHIDASGTEDWFESDDFSFGLGATISGAANLLIEGNIIDQVETYSNNFQIQWKYKVPSGTNSWYNIGTTSHTAYVTWGTPAGSSVTEKRIEFVCDAADGIGGTDPVVAADAVFSKLDNVFDLSAPVWGPSPIWLLHDQGQRSQCPGIADYVNKHLQMLGLGEGVICYCYAKPDGTYVATTSYEDQWRPIIPGLGHPKPTSHDDDYGSERLVHIDGNGKANSYEATCFFHNYHYALVGHGVGKYSTAKEVVKAVFNEVQWQYGAGTYPYTWYKCTEYPWVEAP